MHDTIQHKTNQLGEEIANDMNQLEKKIKAISSSHSMHEDLTKEAMLTLEKKFDKAMEHKPIVRTVKQKLDYAQVQKLIDVPVKMLEQELRFVAG